jgi:predicted SprT family Zn-dependent metalloprotease
MKKQELKAFTNQLARELISIGIPISTSIEDIIINTRAKSRFGACKAKKNKLGIKKFTIEISEEVLECETKDLAAIIIHELLHTCKGCFNHGNKWKLYCEQVEQKLGYKITRTTKYEDLGLERPKEKEEIKYLVKCSGCGAEFPRKRMCNLVKTPERYRCGKCGNILYLSR